MWLLCILMRAADNDTLSKTLHRGCVCADSVGRAAAPWLGLRGGARLQELGTLALESIRRTDGIWFPPFNQVTQAWNAQLCQTQGVSDA